MTSTSQQRKPSTQELRILLVGGVPTHMEWQDVKDEIKTYVPKLTVKKIDGVLGLWSIDIKSKKDADKAYTSLTRIGFCQGSIQIQVTLTDEHGTPIRPLRRSPRPLEPVNFVYPLGQTQPPFNPGQSKLSREFPMPHIPHPSLPPAQPKYGLHIPSASASQQICLYNPALPGYKPSSSDAPRSNSTLYPHSSKNSHDKQRGQGPVVVSKAYYDSDYTDSDE